MLLAYSVGVTLITEWLLNFAVVLIEPLFVFTGVQTEIYVCILTLKAVQSFSASFGAGSCWHSLFSNFYIEVITHGEAI